MLVALHKYYYNSTISELTSSIMDYITQKCNCQYFFGTLLKVCRCAQIIVAILVYIDEVLLCLISGINMRRFAH